MLSDSISRWEARANNLSKIDTIAYIAKISGIRNDVATGAKMTLYYKYITMGNKKAPTFLQVLH